MALAVPRASSSRTSSYLHWPAVCGAGLTSGSGAAGQGPIVGRRGSWGIIGIADPERCIAMTFIDNVCEPERRCYAPNTRCSSRRSGGGGNVTLVVAHLLVSTRVVLGRMLNLEQLRAP
eukprot:SAG31_NODE_941_length_10868_cov_9.232241_4_plen_119_part_00